MYFKSMIVAAALTAAAVSTVTPAAAQFRPCVWPNTCASMTQTP